MATNVTTSMMTNVTKGERERFLEEVNWTLLTRVAPFLVYFSVLMLAGLLGNIVVFAVYYRRFKPSVTRTCVLTMSVVDLLTNIIALPVEILRVRYHATFYADWECKLHWLVLSTLIIFSAVILVLVAVDRRRLICRRYVGQKGSSITKMKIALAVGLGICVILSIPRLIIMGKQTVRFEGTEITGIMCSVTDEYEPTVFVKVYNYILALWFIFMCVTMNVSYGQIACFLRQHKKRGRRSGSTKKLPEPGAGCKVKPEMSIEVCQDSQDSQDDQTADTLPTTESKLSDSEDSMGGDRNQVKMRQPNTKCKAAASKNGTIDLKKISNHPLCGDFKASNHDDIRSNNKMVYTQQQHPTPSKADSSETSEAIYSDSSTDMVVDSQDDSRTADKSITIVSQNPAGAAIPSSTGKRTSSKSTATRRSTGPRGKKIPKRTTLMLFVLSVVFVVNFVPFLVLELIEKLKPSLVAGIEENIFLILTNTQYINSAANPLVYSFCSDRFRYECRKLFGSVLLFLRRRI